MGRSTPRRVAPVLHRITQLFDGVIFAIISTRWFRDAGIAYIFVRDDQSAFVAGYSAST